MTTSAIALAMKRSSLRVTDCLAIVSTISLDQFLHQFLHSHSSSLTGACASISMNFSSSLKKHDFTYKHMCFYAGNTVIRPLQENY